MELAERLHMTRRQLLENLDTEELTLWLAKWQVEADEEAERQRLSALAAKADAVQARKRR